MKKGCSLAFVTLLIFVVLAGCNKEAPGDPANSFSNIVKGTHWHEFHQVFGEPTGTLSGFWGDVYMLNNGTNIIVYYDENGEVEHLKITDKDGTDTLVID